MRLILPAIFTLAFATAAFAQTEPKQQPASGDKAPALSLSNTATLSASPSGVTSSQTSPAPAPPAPQPVIGIASAEEPADPAHPDASELHPGKLLGKVENGRYYSPTHAFDIAIPTLVGEKPMILDNPDIVVFRDDVRTMLSIAAVQMAPIDKWELDTTSPRDFLIKFFRENVLADYAQSFPGTTVESARLVPDLEGGALMVNTLHPDGSAFQIDPIIRNEPNNPKPVAKRGNLIFCHGNHVFVISTELADRVTEMSTYSLDKDTEDRILRDRLLDVHDQMHFEDAPSDKTAPAKTAANTP